MPRGLLTIVYPWHDSNKGDGAILMGTLRLARDFGYDEIAVLPSIDPRGPYWEGALRHTQQEFPLEVFPSPVVAFPKQKGAWLKAFPRAGAKLAFPSLLPSLPGEEVLERSELIVIAGGLYLAFPHSRFWRPPLRLFAYLYPAFYGSRLRRRVIFLGHSLGPFENGWSRRLVAQALMRADAVVLRESRSAFLVRQLTGRSDGVMVAPDMAFYLQPKSSSVVEEFLRNEVRGQPFIALVPRGLKGYGHKAASEVLLETAFLGLIEKFHKNFRLVLVAHTLGPTPQEDDRAVVQRIAQLAQNKGFEVASFQEDVSPEELMWLYSKAAVTVSVRFHGVVLSLAAGTPAVSIPYFGTKAQGALADLGLADLVVPLEEGVTHLLEKSVLRALALPKETILQLADQQRRRLWELGKQLFGEPSLLGVK